MLKPPRIAPSILAADLADLAGEVAAIEPIVDMIHIDVMDGHFVPNVSFGMPVIESLRARTELVFDCHLMMTNALSYFGSLRESGADLVTVHIEVYSEPAEAAAVAREHELGFGLVLNPATPFAAVEPFVELCDMVLVMSVNPGFGGQEFIEESLGKVEQARKFIDSRGFEADIEIDGGIDPTNIRRARDAGVDVFVAGSAVFGADDPVDAIKAMIGQLKT